MKKAINLTSIIITLSALSAGAQIQTLVTGTNALNTNSAVITVPSGSYAVIDKAYSDSDFTLAVSMQGTTLSFDPLEVAVNGYTFVGPATIQLQSVGIQSFATIDVLPLRKAGGTNIQTLFAGSTNNTITVSSNSYAVINSAGSVSGASLVVTEQGIPFSFTIGEVNLNGMTLRGPATIQLQNAAGSSFATVGVSPIRKSTHTQYQTLVTGTDPSSTNSVVLNIPANSSAVIDGTSLDYSSILLLTLQGIPLTFDSSTDNIRNFAFVGPATVQLQGSIYGPSFITVAITTLHN